MHNESILLAVIIREEFDDVENSSVVLQYLIRYCIRFISSIKVIQ